MHKVASLYGLSVFLMVVLSAVNVAEAKRSGSGWTRVGEYASGTSAKEVGVGREISRVRITCTEGSVIINTVVIRQGGQTTPVRVARRLATGESHEITVGNKVNVTGLRISDDGRGRYRVEVRK